jgi:glycosyltransferase involved in cell wall biosynthesis
LPGTRFWLVGDGELSEDLLAQIRERGLAGRVELLGKRSDIPALLAEVDVVVRMVDRTAAYREGIPRTITESLAAGKTVVAADVGGITEILRNGENGIVIPPNDPDALADALRTVCADRSLRDRFALAAGQSVSERFHYRTMVRQIHETYLRLAEQKGLLPSLDSAACEAGSADRHGPPQERG